LIGYAMMLAGGFGWGYLGQVRSVDAGAAGLKRWALPVFAAAIGLSAYGLLSGQLDFGICVYVLCFASTFAVGAHLAAWLLRRSGARPAETVVEVLVNVSVLLAIIGALLMIVDVAGYSLPLRVHGYGLALVIGFLLAVYVAQRYARRTGESPQHVLHIGLLALVGGIGGARLAYVIKYADRFFAAERPIVEILNVTSGGLIYYGGLILATALVLMYLWRKKLPVRRYLDIVTVSLMIGLAFGRIGCTLNGCCYGARCRADWPLAMRFPMYCKPLIKLGGRPGNPFPSSLDSPPPVYEHQLLTGQVSPDPRLIDKELTARTGELQLIPPHALNAEQVAIAAHERSAPVKPAQPLGVANAAILAILLAAFYRLRRREGQVFAMLLILYPITRFVLEMIRDDNSHDVVHGLLTHNQYTSLAILGMGVIMMLLLQKMPASAGPLLAERREQAKAAAGDQNP